MLPKVQVGIRAEVRILIYKNAKTRMTVLLRCVAMLLGITVVAVFQVKLHSTILITIWEITWTGFYPEQVLSPAARCLHWADYLL